ncbi:ionotropic receptor 21a [Musca domestica]|uniref:Uncharacterized protein LOC101892956 n=1 Tax=Musca domestica TaxID=7370 RepID=A0A1I8NEJ8_MUSDO|nr:ionotropic receptor 21a [Musca domestica]
MGGKTVVEMLSAPAMVINWSPIINVIMQIYLQNSTICVLWPQDGELQLDTKFEKFPYSIINIDATNSDEKLMENEVQNIKEKFMEDNPLTLMLTLAIEKSHCESFVAFENDILKFIESFANASRYSVWRSKRNYFVFGSSDRSLEYSLERQRFFEDQPNILMVSGDKATPGIFELKTNKFVGRRADGPGNLCLLDRFYVNTMNFEKGANLFPYKLGNLQGREIIVPGMDYRPYLVINYVQDKNNSYDLAFDGSAEGNVQIDGTEARVILTFCEIFNCTVLIDSTEADDWGEVYSNLSGIGSIGMVAKGMAEITIGAMYSWDTDYIYLDMSMYLVRSGITCLVPAPRRLASWILPLEPFQFTLWLAVVVYLFVEVASLALAYRFESHFISMMADSWPESLKFGVVTTLKLFVSQSGSKKVISQTVRVLLFTCFLNDLIITSIYGGGLASILTVPSYDEAADTLDRLWSQKLQWAANSEAWVSAIRNAEDDRINGILENFFIYPDEKLEQLASSRSGFGFTVERLPFGHFAIGDYLTTESINHLKIMQEDLYFQYTVAFTSRCWPMLSAFDNLLYWWHSAGLDSYWEWRAVADNMNVQKQKQVEATVYSNIEDMGPVKLGMANFVGILLLWMLGVTISFLVFLYEVLRDYVERKNKE